MAGIVIKWTIELELPGRLEGEPGSQHHGRRFHPKASEVQKGPRAKKSDCALRSRLEWASVYGL